MSNMVGSMSLYSSEAVSLKSFALLANEELV